MDKDTFKSYVMTMCVEGLAGKDTLDGLGELLERADEERRAICNVTMRQLRGVELGCTLDDSNVASRSCLRSSLRLCHR